MTEEGLPEHVKERPSKQILVTASIYPGDKEMVEWIAARLGTSRSDAIRTAIRHYYADLTGGRVDG